MRAQARGTRRRIGGGEDGHRGLLRPERSGFTLIEILVVLALSTIIGSALYVSFLIGRQSYLSADSYVQVQQEARRAIDVMDRELRAAQGTALVFTNNPATIRFPIALGYNLAAPCPVDSICWGARDVNGANQQGWWIRYRVDTTDPNNAQLIRDILGPAPGLALQGTRVLANNIDPNAANTNLAFDNVNGVVTINVQARINSSQLPGGSTSVAPNQLTTRVKLRNDG